MAALPGLLLLPLKGEDTIGNSSRSGGESGDRIRDLKVRIIISRDGSVWISQNFRVRVETGLIKRGPILNYLTAFQGPGGLILDNEMQILRVMRDGKSEPCHFKNGDGFVSLYIGTSEVELEPRDYDYSIEYRTGADWRMDRGEFSASFDAAGPMPALPIDKAEVEVVLPEGVAISKYSPAVSGFENSDDSDGTGFHLASTGNTVKLITTRPLGLRRGLFINLVWPSETFVSRSHWMKVMKQHPGIPISVFSAVLLLWALFTILVRASRRSGMGIQ